MMNNWWIIALFLQNNDDSCLTYTLAAMCDLLSKIGICSTGGIIGSQYSLGLGTPLSTQQQLLVLLKRSLKRAESLKLTCLVAFNRLALAGFYLKVKQNTLLKDICNGGLCSLFPFRTCVAFIFIPWQSGVCCTILFNLCQTGFLLIFSHTQKCTHVSCSDSMMRWEVQMCAHPLTFVKFCIDHFSWLFWFPACEQAIVILWSKSVNKAQNKPDSCLQGAKMKPLSYSFENFVPVIFYLIRSYLLCSLNFYFWLAAGTET